MGTNSKILSDSNYKIKMRLVNSIDDLISNSYIKYYSPLTHNNKIFKYGFNNYQGNVKIDNKIFRYLIRIGKAKYDNILYDISLYKIQ